MRLVTFLDTGRYTSGYATPLLAALMQPVHEVDGRCTPVAVDAPPLKTDGLRFTLAQDTLHSMLRITLPELTPTVRIAFALLCARSVYMDERFLTWSDLWLANTDRSPRTAYETFGPGTLPPDDRAYVAHWATMSAAFPQDTCLPAQTAALIAANLFPAGTFDFETRANLALEFDRRD